MANSCTFPSGKSSKQPKSEKDALIGFNGYCLIFGLEILKSPSKGWKQGMPDSLYKR